MSLQEPPIEPTGFKAERRNLTVIFCDIVGSSALATQLDPEDLRDILGAFQARCGEAIRRYDGHVARYMGDGVLAYFGFPAAHEDDAERAVHAALHMIETVANSSLPHAAVLQLRIGIATGLVVVGDLIGEGPSREFALVGEPPNLAASLQQLAKPNQILISPNTRRLLGKLFELGEFGEHTVKGRDQPVRVWSVLRPSIVPSRFEAHQASRLTTFIGRDAELALLFKHYDKAKRGEAQFVAITGEPGIGKSRIIRALCDRLAGEAFHTVLLQSSTYHTSSPWYPIIRHLEDAADISYETPPALKLQKLEALVARQLSKQSERIVPLLAGLLSVPTGDRYPPLELTPQQQKRLTIGALLDMTHAQAEQQPLILVCEDIQWADPTSRELLSHLRQQAKDWPILVLLSSRPGFSLDWADQLHASINVNRLEPAQVACIIESLAEGSALPQALVEQIASKTDGIPLFIEEVTKAVLETGRNDTAGVAPAPSIPDTLHDSLMARLDQLASMKSVAQVSAALGREFTLDFLETISPLSKAELRGAMEQLVASGLVFQLEHAAVETYSFKHALVQDAAYVSMLRDERRALHVRIAEALCTKFSDAGETAPELVAHHYTQARQAKPAIDYWLKAGRQASRRSAFVEAITHFQIALKLLPDLPETTARDEQELQFLQALASAFIAVKGFGADEPLQALDRALQLCGKFSSPPQVFAILNGKVGVHLMRGEFEQSRSVAQDLLARAASQQDQTALLMGHRVLGMTLFVIGELKEAERQLQSAVKLYDPPRHAPLALIFLHDFKATAQAYLGLVYTLRGDIDEGLAYSRDALALAEHLRHPHSICYVLPFVAGAHLIAAMPGAAYPVTERAITLSTEYGFPQWRAAALMLRGWARLELGELEEALADLRLSIDGLRATSTLIWMQFSHFLVARALAKTGRTGEALTLADQILQEMNATSGRWYEAEVHRLRGDLLLGSRNPRESEACYETAFAIAERQGARLLQLRAMTALGSLWRTDARRSGLHARLGSLCAEFPQGIACHDLQQANALLNETAPANLS